MKQQFVASGISQIAGKTFALGIDTRGGHNFFKV